MLQQHRWDLYMSPIGWNPSKAPSQRETMYSHQLFHGRAVLSATVTPRVPDITRKNTQRESYAAGMSGDDTCWK